MYPPEKFYRMQQHSTLGMLSFRLIPVSGPCPRARPADVWILRESALTAVCLHCCDIVLPLPLFSVPEAEKYM